MFVTYPDVRYLSGCAFTPREIARPSPNRRPLALLVSEATAASVSNRSCGRSHWYSYAENPDRQHQPGRETRRTHCVRYRVSKPARI